MMSKKVRYAVGFGIFIFAIALAATVILLMLNRGPALVP